MLHRASARALPALFAFVSIFIATLYGCGGDDSSDPPAANTPTIDGGTPTDAPPSNPGVKTQAVGAEGATVVSNDGKVSLVIPAGALATSTNITIEAIDVSRLGPEWQALLAQQSVGKMYELGPSGTTFAVPIRVERRIDDEGAAVQPDGTVRTSTRAWYSSSAGATYNLTNPTMTLGADNVFTLTGEMSHFSPVVEVWPTKYPDFEAAENFTFGISQPGSTKVGEQYIAAVRITSTSPKWSASGGRSMQDSTSALSVASPRVDLIEMGNGVGADIGITCTKEATGAGQTHLTFAQVNNGFFSFAVQMSVRLETTHDCIAAGLTKYFLTAIVSGTGEGTITSDPAGIICSKGSGVCQKDFLNNIDVGLTATPSPGSIFKQWGVNATGTTPTSSVKMSEARSVSAEFELLPKYALNVSVTGTGDGTVTSSPTGIACSKEVGPCSAEFGGEVTLTPTPKPGSKFKSWSVGGTVALPLTMDSAKTISAEFELLPQLTVQVIGDGEVSGAPLTAPCTGTCVVGVDTPANQVTLAATKHPASVFSHWSGKVSSALPSVFLGAVDVDASETATFITQIGGWIGDLDKTADGANHDPFVFNVGTGKSVTITVGITGTAITFTGTTGFTPSTLPVLTGVIATDDTFTATGTGTIAGLTGVKVNVTGSIVGTATGAAFVITSMVVGAPGGTQLPTGTPITYSFNGTR